MGFGPSFQFAKISFSKIAEMVRFARQFDGDREMLLVEPVPCNSKFFDGYEFQV